jgi:hypothetical protein
MQLDHEKLEVHALAIDLVVSANQAIVRTRQ